MNVKLAASVLSFKNVDLLSCLIDGHNVSTCPTGKHTYDVPVLTAEFAMEHYLSTHLVS